MDLTTKPRTWQDSAACADADLDLFFPERGKSAEAAKAICATCPVRAECLDYALDEGIKHGIFGGMSERERRKIRRRRAAAAGTTHACPVDGCDVTSTVRQGIATHLRTAHAGSGVA